MIRRPPRSTLFPYTTALPISAKWSIAVREVPRALATGKCDLRPESQAVQITHDARGRANAVLYIDKDRKSTRLNSSHANISYAVFCLKKKKENKKTIYGNMILSHAQLPLRCCCFFF